MEEHPRSRHSLYYGPPTGSYNILLPHSATPDNFQTSTFPLGSSVNFSITGLPTADEELSSSSGDSDDGRVPDLKESLTNTLSNLPWSRDETGLSLTTSSQRVEMNNGRPWMRGKIPTISEVKDAVTESIAKLEESMDLAWEWLSRPVSLCAGPTSEQESATEEVVHKWHPVIEYESITTVPSLGDDHSHSGACSEMRLPSASHHRLSVEAPSSIAPSEKSTRTSSSQHGQESRKSKFGGEPAVGHNTLPIEDTAKKVIDKMISRRRGEKATLYADATPLTSISPPCEVIPDETEASVDSFGIAAQRVR